MLHYIIPGVLFIILIAVIIAYYIISKNNKSYSSSPSSSPGSNDFPLGLGKSEKKLNFKNISYFQSSSYLDNLKKMMGSVDMCFIKDGKLVIDGSSLDDNFFKYMAVTNRYDKEYTSTGGQKQKPSVFEKVEKITSKDPNYINEIKLLIPQLNADEIEVITYMCLLNLVIFGNKLLDVTKYFDKNCRYLEGVKTTDFNVMFNVISNLLNTDVINNNPKIGSGWDQYTIKDTTVKGDNVPIPILSSIKTPTPPVKSAILKFWGSESESLSPSELSTSLSLDNSSETNGPIRYIPPKRNTSKVTVTLTGKDADNNNLGSYETDLAFSRDPSELYPNIFILPLKYPVIIDSVSIKGSSTNTAKYVNGSDDSGNSTGGLLLIYK